MSEPSGSSGAPATSDVLAGSAWVVASIDGEPVTGLEPVTVEFGHDGRVTGSTGVNRFTASYSVSAAYLTIGPMATTRRGSEEGPMAQEQRVVASLAGMCSFELGEGHLAIDGPMGWVELSAAGGRSAPERGEPHGSSTPTS